MAAEELGLEVAVKGFTTFMSQMGQMDSKIGGVSGAWNALGRVVSPITGILKTVAKVGFAAVAGAATLAVGAVAGVTAAMVKLGQESVETATEFQSSMVNLQIAASATELSYDQLHDAALQVGADTRLLGVSASGAAESMTGLYKAGLTTTEIFGDLQGYMSGTAELGGALRAAIDLAAASELDMVQASDLAAIALATFGGELETEEARAQFVTSAMNNLVQAADASVAEVSDLGMALKNVGPVAAQFGFSIEDTNNALAILSTRGITGAEAGTALRSMFTNIMRPTANVQEALDALNVSLYDSEGVMLGLPDIIGQFETAMTGLTEEQRNQYVQTLAGTYGMRAFNTLIGEGVEGWNDMAEATGAAMTIQEQGALRAETYAAKVESLQGVIETLKIGIGEALLPVLTDLTTWFSEMVTEYGPALQSVFEFIGAKLGTLFEYMTTVVSSGTLFTDFLADLPLPLQNIINGLRPVIENLQVLGATIQEWFAENGPAILAQLQEIWVITWQAIQEISANFIVWWQENLPLIQETITTILDWFVNVFLPFMVEAWGVLVDTVTVSMSVIQEIITLAMQIITGDWAGAWETIEGILVTAWDAIVKLTGDALTTMQGHASAGTNAIHTIIMLGMARILTTIQEKIRQIQDWIRGQIGAFRSIGSDIIDAIRAGVMAAAGALAAAAANAVRSAIDAARSAVGSVAGAIGVPGFQRGSLSVPATMAALVHQGEMIIPARQAAMIRSTTSNVTNNFNLTTQSITRPGGLAAEFGAMQAQAMR